MESLPLEFQNVSLLQLLWLLSAALAAFSLIYGPILTTLVVVQSHRAKLRKELDQ